ncbi:uncharacterized protein B0I36DRAFT_361415 [Microdochium trichocladiopsis]|uniref:Uncharacterized protein n=1 Tax=Microdochium trichocladiopsis TaxID=1682393 RepID=A0A9P8YAP4_9PEZI|nr:uncharacterized protein B0I36DRAFT_361415 [Microdochium trichocladiopsis]KAH7032633.1 hypothetical protein B0I36DRAFT_361415 [Microdochium trichocladiopsis]
MPSAPAAISLPPPPPPASPEGAAVAGSSHVRNVLIYMISGNPGLVGFYRPFLTTLRQLLDEQRSGSPRFHIYGQDLAGFSDADHDCSFSSPANPPRDLEFQITHVQTTLRNLGVDADNGTIQTIPPGQHRDAPRRPFDDIVLVGHSVGSYIALELFHRNMALRQQQQQQQQQQTSAPSAAAPLNLRSAILLFPTITHIAQSTAGKRLDMLRQIPVLGPNAYRIARGLLAVLPAPAVSWIVSSVLRFPPHAAEVLVPWLKSRDGVWQALYMGMDEMRVIREDKWDRELWEIEHDPTTTTAAAGVTSNSSSSSNNNTQAVNSSSFSEPATPPPPKFFFFFGQNDHWVADHYRDLFIAERTTTNGAGTVKPGAGDDEVTEAESDHSTGGNSSSSSSSSSRSNSQKPPPPSTASTRIVVDEGNLPHAFCIHHSKTVAEKVHSWLRELYPSRA